MSVCSSCGKLISDSAKFCPECGAQVIMSFEKAEFQDQERKGLLAKLEIVREVAIRCKPHYEAYNRWQRAMDIAVSKVYENKEWKIPFFIGLPFAIIFGFSSCVFIGQPGSFAVMIPVFLLIAGWIILCVSIRSSTEKKNEQQRAINNKTFYDAKIQQQRILDVISDIYDKSEISDFFPQEYLFEDAVNRIIMLVKTKRADTLKEAINLFEEELHRLRMEESQNQQLAALRRSEALQRSTRDMVSFAAAMSAISVLSNRK